MGEAWLRGGIEIEKLRAANTILAGSQMNCLWDADLGGQAMSFGNSGGI